MIWDTFSLSLGNCLSFSPDWAVELHVKGFSSILQGIVTSPTPSRLYRLFWQNLNQFFEWNNLYHKKRQFFPSNPTLTLPSIVVSVMGGKYHIHKGSVKMSFFFFFSCWCSELEIHILRWNMAFRHSPRKWLGFSLSLKSTSQHFKVKAFSNTMENLQSSDFLSAS